MPQPRPLVLAFALSFCALTLSAQSTVSPIGAQPFRKLPAPAGAPPLAPANSQGATLLQQAITALAGQTPPTEVTLQGNITVFRPGGSTATGAIVLVARGDNQAEITMNLTTGTSTEVRSISDTSGPAEMLTAANGTVSHNPVQSLLSPYPAWFLPQFVLEAEPAANLASSFIAAETRAGVPVNHLQISGVPVGPSLFSHSAQNKTQFDIYLDPATSLPVAMVYWMEPITPPNTPDRYYHKDRRVPIEIRFLSYQNVEGIAVAHRLQVFVQNHQVYDIQIASVSFNTGVVIPVIN